MTVIQYNMPTRLHDAKSAVQTTDNQKLLSTSGGANLSPPIDAIDIKHASLSDPSNHVRTLEAGAGQKAVITFSEKTLEVSALLVSKDGVSKIVPKENLPKDFENIKTLDSFKGFLENAQARGAIISDGEAKLYIMQKGLGGSGKFGGSPAGGGTANGNWMQNMAQVPSAPMPNASGVYGGLSASSAQHGVGTSANLGVGIAGPGGSVGASVLRSQGFPTNGMNPSKPSTTFVAGFKLNL